MKCFKCKNREPKNKGFKVCSACEHSYEYCAIVNCNYLRNSAKCNGSSLCFVHWTKEQRQRLLTKRNYIQWAEAIAS